MRQKISITVDEGTLLRVADMLRNKKFRNKSHFFELAAEKLLEEDERHHIAG